MTDQDTDIDAVTQDQIDTIVDDTLGHMMTLAEGKNVNPTEVSYQLMLALASMTMMFAEDQNDLIEMYIRDLKAMKDFNNAGSPGVAN